MAKVVLEWVPMENGFALHEVVSGAIKGRVILTADGHGHAVADGLSESYVGGAEKAKVAVERFWTERPAYIVAHQGVCDDTRTDELGFSVRTANCMRAEGIETLRDLRQMTERRLLEIPNFGRRCLEEVRRLLVERGLPALERWPPY